MDRCGYTTIHVPLHQSIALSVYIFTDCVQARMMSAKREMIDPFVYSHRYGVSIADSVVAKHVCFSHVAVHSIGSRKITWAISGH
jgi:hypothetical protein